MKWEQSHRAMASPAFGIAEFQEFLTTPLEAQLERYQHTSPESVALALFHDVAASVPAYKAFLREHNIHPASIQTIEDFQKLSLITKENYLLRQPLADLCRNGQIDRCNTSAVSSGSTGNPTFCPRFITDELQTATRFEQIFHDSFNADTQPTRAVICFTLGTWVGRIYTTNFCHN